MTGAATPTPARGLDNWETSCSDRAEPLSTSSSDEPGRPHPRAGGRESLRPDRRKGRGSRRKSRRPPRSRGGAELAPRKHGTLAGIPAGPECSPVESTGPDSRGPTAQSLPTWSFCGAAELLQTLVFLESEPTQDIRAHPVQPLLS
ncbi:protein Mpv17 isoform X2 [Pipistrellus kuhlii]|uniref:protein Mpv17 isoform X2 n=1 Tax=Pipistrellus kuhlii TaxID=59472 RepID=UPI001E270FD4|nr:protein Mpv17 isoform X2 [Pipistrellus kuhlii]